MMTFTRLFILGLTVLVTCFSAAGQEDFEKATHGCAKDYKEFCKPKKIVPTLKDDFACLHMNFSKLAKTCQDFIDLSLEHRPCMIDVQNFCIGTDRNLNRHIVCLQANRGKISKSCQSYLEKSMTKAKAATAKFEELCKEDIKSCADLGVPAKGECIYALYNKNKFGPACKAEADRLMKKKPAY